VHKGPIYVWHKSRKIVCVREKERRGGYQNSIEIQTLKMYNKVKKRYSNTLECCSVINEQLHMNKL